MRFLEELERRCLTWLCAAARRDGRSVPQADIAIEDGSIAAIGPELPGATEEIDARGLHVFPGLIDVHLHFNEPGRTEWEGAATGSRALAAGGGTLFFDMPLNSAPCTVNAAAFDAQDARRSESSITDFGFGAAWFPAIVHRHGGAGRSRRRRLQSLSLRFRACRSFPAPTISRCTKACAKPPAWDCPSRCMRKARRSRGGCAAHREGRDSIRAFLASRPVIAELEAIQRAALLAREAGARLHIVHVSSGRGVAAGR